jgi:hypothetical protein
MSFCHLLPGGMAVPHFTKKYVISITEVICFLTCTMKEAIGAGLIGFQKKWHGGNTEGPVPEEDLLNHEDFKHVAYKWHVKLHRVWHSLYHLLADQPLSLVYKGLYLLLGVQRIHANPERHNDPH